MKKLLALSAALLATACGQRLEPSAIADAMPTSAVVRIDVPSQATAVAAPVGVQARQALVEPGQPAPLAVVSAAFAAAVNGGVFWTLAPISWFTQAVPPTSCTETACTWGPGAGAEELNTWMLVVTKGGEAYDYTLSAAPRSPAGAPFVPVISGRAYPGAVEHRGHGSFTVDFDQVWAGLAHPAGAVQEDFGTMTVSYDARTSLAIDVAFLESKNQDDPGADPANPNRVNTVYAFDATAAGGDLQLGWRTLAPYTVDAPQKQVSLHTRWLEGGAGRADARVALPGLAAEVSQCWDGAPTWAMTFSPADQLGSEAACVFPSAAPITLTVP